MDEANPTARALRALQLLQDRPGLGARELGDRLGVSDRAARRYVAVLREAGVPIESLRGPYGGYRIGRGLRLPPLMFTATEALGLVMAVLDGHHDARDAASLVGGALDKIVRALPEPVAAQAEAVRRATAPAPDRGAARPDPETASALVQAATQRHRVRLDYRSESAREWTSEVDPWAVVVRHGRWYLLCWSHRAQDRRAYRVDRVTGVEPLPQTFEAPLDLDAVVALEEHLAVGWEYDAEVVVKAPIDVAARWLPRTLGRLTVVDEETTRLSGSTSNPAWYAGQLAALPVPFRVVRCSELQQAVGEIGQRLLAAGEPSASPGQGER